MKHSRTASALATVLAFLAVAGCTPKEDGSSESSVSAKPTMAERASLAAADMKQTGAEAVADARETIAEWTEALSEKSTDLRAKVGVLLESAKSTTSNLGDNARTKVNELAALMPEIQAQAAKLKTSSGDAAKAAGDKLHAMMARAEELYREVTGGEPTSASSKKDRDLP